MKQLKFSTNWNGGKLNNKFFTTLRLSDRFEIGDTVEIFLKDKKIKQVIVRDKKAFHIENINPFIAGLDTGYSVEETKKILKKMYPQVNWQTQYIVLYLLETEIEKLK